LRAAGLACYYGKCLKVEPFELGPKAVLLGSNGSGKTTVLTLFNPFLFDVGGAGALRRALVTYTSLKWPLPELLYAEAEERRLLMVRLHPFKRYDAESFAREAEEVMKRYEGIVEAVREAKEALRAELRYALTAEGYSFQINAFIHSDGLTARIVGNRVELSSEVGGSDAPAYLTPHAPLVRNVLAGSLKEGSYPGPCLRGLPKVRRVIEEAGEVSPVKVVYEADGEELELEPWVLGDGEKAMLLYCALRGARHLFVDSPEAFMAPESAKALAEDLNARERAVVATASEEMAGMLTSLKRYVVKRVGSEVEVKASP